MLEGFRESQRFHFIFFVRCFAFMPKNFVTLAITLSMSSYHSMDPLALWISLTKRSDTSFCSYSSNWIFPMFLIFYGIWKTDILLDSKINGEGNSKSYPFLFLVPHFFSFFSSSSVEICNWRYRTNRFLNYRTARFTVGLWAKKRFVVTLEAMLLGPTNRTTDNGPVQSGKMLITTWNKSGKFSSGAYLRETMLSKLKTIHAMRTRIFSSYSIVSALLYWRQREYHKGDLT